VCDIADVLVEINDLSTAAIMILEKEIDGQSGGDSEGRDLGESLNLPDELMIEEKKPHRIPSPIHVSFAGWLRGDVEFAV
jgi:hypothetical protein